MGGMNLEIKGKNALVTGGCNGIGKSISYYQQEKDRKKCKYIIFSWIFIKEIYEYIEECLPVSWVHSVDIKY